MTAATTSKIFTLWRFGFDTNQISKHLKCSEAEVYNSLSRRIKAKVAA